MGRILMRADVQVQARLPGLEGGGVPQGELWDPWKRVAPGPPTLHTVFINDITSVGQSERFELIPKRWAHGFVQGRRAGFWFGIWTCYTQQLSQQTGQFVPSRFGRGRVLAGLHRRPLGSTTNTEFWSFPGRVTEVKAGNSSAFGALICWR